MDKKIEAKGRVESVEIVERMIPLERVLNQDSKMKVEDRHNQSLFIKRILDRNNEINKTNGVKPQCEEKAAA